MLDPDESFRLTLSDTRKRLIGLHGILVGSGEILGKASSEMIESNITQPKCSRWRSVWIHHQAEDIVTACVDDPGWFHSPDHLLLLGLCELSIGCTSE